MTKLEEAASEYSKKYPPDIYKTDKCTVIPSYTARNSFIAGAEWQSRQSPWISVEERLPDPNEVVLCLMKSNEAIVSGFIQIIRDHKPKVLTLPNFEFEDNMDYEPAYWMHIPELQKGGRS